MSTTAAVTIWWTMAAMVTGVKAVEDTAVCVNSTEVTTCFEEGTICDSGNDYDNDVSSSLFDLHSPIVCKFSLVETSETYNQDYPNCTMNVTEEMVELEDQQLTLPVEYFTGDAVQQHVVLSPLEINTTDANITVSWGMGSTCDGQVVLFFNTTSPEYYSPYLGENQVVAVEHLDALLQKGGSISGKGTLWAYGSAIHRHLQREEEERDLHIGCAIGGFTTYSLEGTCALEINAKEDEEEAGAEEEAAEGLLESSSVTTSASSSSSSISHKNDLLFSKLGGIWMAMGMAQFGGFLV